MKGKKCELGATVHISTPKKKMTFKKYAEGTKGIFSKLKKKQDEGNAVAEQIDAEDEIESTPAPKKMNFFSKLKAKQEAGNKEAEVIDEEDYNDKPKSEIESISPKEVSVKKSVTKVNTPEKVGTYQETSFVGPKDNKPKSPIKESSNKEVTRMTPIELDKAPTEEMRKVMEYQKKRGLKADGVWGKETKEAYENEQKAKSAKKMQFKSKPEFKNTDFSAEVKSNPAYKAASVSKTSTPTTATKPKYQSDAGDYAIAQNKKKKAAMKPGKLFGFDAS